MYARIDVDTLKNVGSTLRINGTATMEETDGVTDKVIEGMQIRHFINNGGDTMITGDNRGMTFRESMVIQAGSVTIDSALEKDITASITLNSGATLTVNNSNNFTGKKFVNAGTVVLRGRGVNVDSELLNEGKVTITDADSLGVDAALSALTGRIVNSGSFVINQVGLTLNNAGKGFINEVSGKFQLNRYAIFHALENKGDLIFGTTETEGTMLYNLVNRGNITVNVSNIIFSNGLTNHGSIKVNGENVHFKNMVDSEGNITFVNEDTGKIYFNKGTTLYGLYQWS